MLMLAGLRNPIMFQHQRGTILCMPPELLNVDEQGYPLGTPTYVTHHQAADIWGAACAAYRMLTGYVAFDSDSQPVFEEAKEVRRKQIAFVSSCSVCTAYLSCTAMSKLAWSVSCIATSTWSDSVLAGSCVCTSPIGYLIHFEEACMQACTEESTAAQSK